MLLTKLKVRSTLWVLAPFFSLEAQRKQVTWKRLMRKSADKEKELLRIYKNLHTTDDNDWYSWYWLMMMMMMMMMMILRQSWSNAWCFWVASNHCDLTSKQSNEAIAAQSVEAGVEVGAAAHDHWMHPGVVCSAFRDSSLCWMNSISKQRQHIRKNARQYTQSMKHPLATETSQIVNLSPSTVIFLFTSTQGKVAVWVHWWIQCWSQAGEFWGFPTKCGETNACSCLFFGIS